MTFPLPVPVPTDLSRPHWDGCSRGELLFQRCGSCAKAVFPPALSCPLCTSLELSWEQSSGRGVVYSHTVVWRPQVPAFEVPYVVAVVAVEEGWHLFTNVVGTDPATVHAGQPVHVQFVPVGGVTLPYFTPDLQAVAVERPDVETEGERA
jgi:uncharacterized OB-fold protein